MENHVSRKGTLSQFIKTKCLEDFGDLERLKRLFKVKIKTFGRGATVKVVSPNGKLTIINRPLSKLYPVEVRDRCPKVVTDINLKKVVESVGSKEHGRLKRAAALDADALRRMRDSL